MKITIISHYGWNLNFYAYFPTSDFFFFPLQFLVMWTDTVVSLARISNFPLLQWVINFQLSLFNLIYFWCHQWCYGKDLLGTELAFGVREVGLLLAACSSFSFRLYLLATEGFFCVFSVCWIRKTLCLKFFKGPGCCLYIYIYIKVLLGLVYIYIYIYICFFFISINFFTNFLL